MFEVSSSALAGGVRDADDAGVLASMSEAAVEENAACARRLDAMGELYVRRAPEDDDERTSWLSTGTRAWPQKSLQSWGSAADGHADSCVMPSVCASTCHGWHACSPQVSLICGWSSPLSIGRT